MIPFEKLLNDARIAQLQTALSTHVPLEVDDTGARRAAVAILIRPGGNDEPEVCFIQRATFESDPWSGQIAFPGGREEPGDASLVETAIRETFEETEFDLRNSARLIGALDDLRPRAAQLPAIVVRPFVFLVGELAPPVLSAEVANCFWVPLSVLLDRSVWRDTTVRAGGMEMSRFAFHHQGFVVWGMTEIILSGLLALAGENQVPGPADEAKAAE